MSGRSIVLGDELQDIVSGFKGIAVSKLQSIDGSTSYGVLPRSKGDKLSEVTYFDKSRIEKVSDGVRVKPAKRTLGFDARGGDA